MPVLWGSAQYQSLPSPWSIQGVDSSQFGSLAPFLFGSLIASSVVRSPQVFTSCGGLDVTLLILEPAAVFG